MHSQPILDRIVAHVRIPNQKHASFYKIKFDPLGTLDKEKLDEWLQKHKTNMMLDAPMQLDEREIDEEFYEHEFDEDDDL